MKERETVTKKFSTVLYALPHVHVVARVIGSGVASVKAELNFHFGEPVISYDS